MPKIKKVLVGVFIVFLFIVSGELLYLFLFNKNLNIVDKNVDIQKNLEVHSNPYVSLIIKDRGVLFNYSDSDFQTNESVGKYFLRKICEYPQDNYLNKNKKPQVPIEDLSVKPKHLAFYALRGFACKPKDIRYKQVLLVKERGKVAKIIKDKYMLKLLPLNENYGMMFNAALQYDAEKVEIFTEDKITGSLKKASIDDIKIGDIVDIEYRYDYIKGAYTYYKIVVKG